MSKTFSLVSLSCLLFLFLVPPLLADEVIKISKQFSCLIPTAGEAEILNTKKNQTNSLDFTVALRRAKKAVVRVSKKIKALKKNGGSRTAIKKQNKIRKNKREVLSEIEGCRTGTLSQEGVSEEQQQAPTPAPPSVELPDNIRSQITLESQSLRNPGGIVCELNTGTTPVLSAEFGGEALNTGGEIAGILACRTQNGEALESEGGFVTGFITTQVGTDASVRHAFRIQDLPAGSVIVVSQMCLNDSTCANPEQLHKEHHSGSPLSLRLVLSLSTTGQVDFQGEFGGRGAIP